MPWMRFGAPLLFLLASAGSSGCADERPRERHARCATWAADIQPVLADACVACHGPSMRAGEYDLSTYLGALGAGTDRVANAVAGDASSLVLRVLDPAGADDTHAPFTGLHATVSRWVVECELAYADSRIHEGGIMNPADPAFHGALLAQLSWDFDRCAECHGADFAGGTSGASCLSCHEDGGPTDCSTCHGSAISSGAHTAHTTAGALGERYECTTCHVLPTDYRDPGHIFVPGAPGLVDGPPAEVIFGVLARGPNPAEPPSYDPATGRCENVYCHGASLGDDNALDTTPEWQAGGPAACGDCHGLPPSSHADDRCAVCHGGVVAEDRSILDSALHIDAAVSIGAGTGDSCTGCHGPPRDLEGRTDPALVTVGAHTSHVEGLHGLRGPIPCADCHAMPQALDSRGHIDSPAPAEVFWSPAGPFTGLAAAAGALPMWDRASATCTDVYCHGGGTSSLADDMSPDLMRTPVWTAINDGQAACGTCHGAPPITDAHLPDMGLDTCHTCHPGTTDPFGNIIISGPAGARTSEHIDGELDL